MNETATGNLLAASKLFNWVDYATFGSLLGLSALIGIYYGCIKGTKNSKVEYMLGGKSMHVFPIAMSLITSHISGVTLLGIPAEIYEYGTQYIVLCISTIFVVYVTNEFYLPVFHALQLNSLYEYLELRFSRTVRAVASLIFTLSVILHIPVVIYIPCLAFNQVTGVSVHHLAPLISILCIFYTSIGGLKAVVWTDAIQGIFTFGAMISVIVLGLNDTGGISKVIELNNAGDRLEIFNMNPSPLARNTFWTVTIGGFFLITTGMTVSPGSSQRFIALPTVRDAKRSVLMFGVGMIVIKLLAALIGLIIYAKYHSCDPIKSGIIETSGQLIPYYVQDVAADFPGLTGIFISGLISAALSTMSASLNTLAGTLYEDFFAKCISKKSNTTKANFIMKITVVILGCICVIMVYLVEHLKGILQMAISLLGITAGPVFAVFAMGVFYPWANTKGVIWGMIVSVIIMLTIVINSQIAIATNNLIFIKKPTTVQNCTMIPTSFKNENLTHLIEITDGVLANEDMQSIFAISYMYYAVLGSIIAIVVSIVVSYLTGGTDLEKLNPDLVAPPMRRYLPKTSLSNRYNTEKQYQQVMQEMDTYVVKSSSNGTL